MVVLILGAAGNLGTAYRKLFLKKEDISLVAWDKTELDVTDSGILNKKILEIKPEVIINLVAYNKVDDCEKNKSAQAMARSLNIEFVKSLGEIALTIGATLIHYSSDYVFKGDNHKGYKEADLPDPQNFYGQTKYGGEQELLKLTGRGLKWYLIRTSKLFGPNGLSPVSKVNFFELILSLAKQGKAIKAISNESGSFTYTPDLALASWSLIEENCAYGIYHLVNSGQASWYEAAKYFLQKFSLSIDIKSIKSQDFIRSAKIPKYSLLVNTKRPVLRSWQEAVDEYVSNFK